MRINEEWSYVLAFVFGGQTGALLWVSLSLLPRMRRQADDRVRRAENYRTNA